MKITQKHTRTIVVGDLHGCMAELQALLQLLDFSANDLLIAVGDLVDRGPASWQVATFFRETPNAFSVLGNHERRVAGVISGRSQPAWTQQHTLSKLKDGSEQKWLEYFESLPAVIETNHAIITHARLDPEKSLENQDPYHTCGVGGEMANIVMDEQGIPVWFHSWKEKYGSEKPICIGHLEYKCVELVTGKLYGLDTEAVKGGRVTAVVLPEGRIVEVHCTANHYEQAHREWMEKQWEHIDAPDFNIKLMLKIQDKGQQANKYEQVALKRFLDAIVTLDDATRISLLKQKMLKCFGPVPQSGHEKGLYFIGIRESVQKQWMPLVKLVYLTHPNDSEGLLKLYQGKLTTLKKFADDLDAFEQWLNSKSSLSSARIR